MCSSVLLPVPEAPTIASISPRANSNERLSKSTSSEAPERKDFFNPSTLSACCFRCKWSAPRLKSARRRSKLRLYSSLSQLKHGGEGEVAGVFSAIFSDLSSRAEQIVREADDAESRDTIIHALSSRPNGLIGFAD